MKAAVLLGVQNLKITDFNEPPLLDNGVKVAVAYCGLCGTDFHKFLGKAGSRPVVYPVPLGHEVSGVVVDVGKNVTEFKKGDRVTVDPNWSCCNCYYCKNGKRHLCSNSKGVVKGLAEYICPPKENVYLIPDSLSLLDASLTEPLSCCLHGVDLLDIKSGETVAVVGCGAIGALMLQILKVSGVGKIIAIDANEEKRSIAMELGAFAFINPKTESVEETVKNLGVECVDKVIECVGIPKTAELALTVAGRGATVVLFGVSDSTAILPIKWYDAFTKELVIKTSYINPNTTDRAISMLENGLINVDKAISAVISMEDVIEEISTRAFSSKGKVIVKVNENLK